MSESEREKHVSLHHDDEQVSEHAEADELEDEDDARTESGIPADA